MDSTQCTNSNWFPVTVSWLQYFNRQFLGNFRNICIKGSGKNMLPGMTKSLFLSSSFP